MLLFMQKVNEFSVKPRLVIPVLFDVPIFIKSNVAAEVAAARRLSL